MYCASQRSNSCISGTLRSRSREENQNYYRTWSHSQRSIPELYSRTVTSSLPGGTYRTLERDRICGSVRKIEPIRRSCGNLPVQTNIYHICNLWNINKFIFIYILCLFVLYPINVKTAEPIGPKPCVATHMIPGKVNG